MTATEARDAVKARLDIQDTTYDTDIDDMVTLAVNKLAPLYYVEDMEDTTALTADTDFIALPNSMIEAKQVEVYNTDHWEKLDDWYQQEDNIYLNWSSSSAETLRIMGYAAAAITDIDTWVEPVIINWGVSEFYSFLIGNKRKFNAYMQASGVRSTAEMRELSDYYLERGNQELMDRVQLRGN